MKLPLYGVHGGFGVWRILNVSTFTAWADIKGREHSVSVAMLSTVWEINRVSGVYGSFVIGLSFFSRIIILWYFDSHGW